MGMFDDVDIELMCQRCRGAVSGFQSKDGPCLLERLTPMQLFDVGGPGSRFYTSCDSCGFWNEWQIESAESDRLLLVQCIGWTP